MDTKALIKSLNARFDHNTSKLLLQEKYKQKLLLPFQGGLWNITIELLSFLKSSPPTTILIDSLNNPVKVDTEQFLQIAQEQYDITMNEWLAEYDELRENR